MSPVKLAYQRNWDEHTSGPGRKQKGKSNVARPITTTTYDHSNSMRKNA